MLAFFYEPPAGMADALCTIVIVVLLLPISEPLGCPCPGTLQIGEICQFLK